MILQRFGLLSVLPQLVPLRLLACIEGFFVLLFFTTIRFVAEYLRSRTCVAIKIPMSTRTDVPFH